MAVDDRSDPHSAYRIIAGLGEQTHLLIASTSCKEDTSRQVLGCVLGGILNRLLIDAYGLGPYGAQTGDGLLAYIGLRPVAQGSRAWFCRDDIFDVRQHQMSTQDPENGESLASLLFSKWLDLAAITSCSQVFIRTRATITPILHLASKYRFEYCGKFLIDFQGEQQERLVFKRSKREADDSRDANGAFLP